MSFYFKSYSNPNYKSFNSSYGKTFFEIDGFLYLLGGVYYPTLGRQLAFISKKDGDGNIVFEKGFDIQDSTQGGWEGEIINFSDIFKLSNGNFVLTIFDKDQVAMICLSPDFEQTIWYKKYYDRKDVSLIYNGLSISPKFCKLVNDEIIVSIDEIHSLNGGINLINHQFLNVNINSGDIIFSKKFEGTPNDYYSFRDVTSYESNIILTGDYKTSAFIIVINREINIVKKWFFNIDNLPVTNKSIRGYKLSNISNNKLALLGWYYTFDSSTSTIKDCYFILEFDINNGITKPALLLNGLKFFQGYNMIKLENDFIYFFEYSKFYKLSLANNQIIWGKQNDNIVSDIITSDYIISYTYSYDKFIVACLDKNFTSCKTKDLNIDYSIETFLPQLSNYNIVLNSNSLPIYVPNPILNKISIVGTAQTNLCPSTEKEIKIIQDNTLVSPLLKGIQIINQNIGTLTIQNTTNSSVFVNAGTIIAQANGLYFSLKDNTTFTPGSTTDVIILANGRPETKGSFNPIIFLYEVQNPNNFAIEFSVVPNKKQIDLYGAKLQSPEFFLQAVGSNGINETKGIHLRWEFGGEFGVNHIPKGNLAASNNFYNKPNDFVTILRYPYNTRKLFTIDFNKIPDFINVLKRYWVYKYDNERYIYIYFRNKSLFNKALSQISPQTSPLQFIQTYGGIIEVENKSDLFFSAEVEISNKGVDSSLQLEGLSLSRQDTYNTKVLSYRNLFKSSDLSASTKFNIENGRSIRFKVKDCLASKVHFEYYSDFIIEANKIGWEVLGTFSLSLDDNEAFSRLEPNTTDNRVHGRWKKFNDNHFVNIDNYKHKWNGVISDENAWERSIKKTVEKYISLSENSNNPRANEIFNFNQIEPNSSSDEEGGYETYPEENNEVSNLDLLKIAALDFHVARMLGMGTMDIDSTIFDGQYVYIAEYDKKDYNQPTPEKSIENSYTYVKQLSMSLPTSINNERLPISVDISEIRFGLPNENSESSNLYDENGYTMDGKKRVVSIYTKEPFEYKVYPPFFDSFQEFDASTFTMPIYAGLEHRYYLKAQNPIVWQSPELSHDSDYFIYGSETIGETLPILIPEENSALYVHFHNVRGKYFYTTYGIDWFSRASAVANNPTSDKVKVVITDLKPANTLLPPSGINAHLIKEENPLMFTSLSEQNRLKSIPTNSDNTLVRMLFDYNASHDIKIYNVESENSVIFPDDEEVFADHVEIFYRSSTPKSITAKVTNLLNVANNILLMQVKTENYKMISTGEIYESKYPDGTNTKNFEGGIFLMNQQPYIIHSIEPGTTNLTFNLYKKEASDLLLSGKYSDLSASTLQNKLLFEIANFTDINEIIVGDGLFVATENMQTALNWGTKNPNQLKVKLGNTDWSVNRELINVTSEDGNVQKFIEKTRGFWGKATVSKFLEDHVLINDKGNYIDASGNEVVSPVIVKNIHKGIYKIEFNNFKLPQHEQFSSDAKSVEWFNGFVRLFKVDDILDNEYINTRTSLKVFKTENIGDSTKNLVLYIIDENFKFDYRTGLVFNPNPNKDFLLGNDVLVNYYPSYKVYLYSDLSNDLTKENIYGDKDINYSILGLRSIDTMYLDSNNQDYASKFSSPSILLAQKNIEPQKPKQPRGALYTTRPDFYGKATYTFQVGFEDNPFAVQFYRADDNSLLNALYSRETIEEINLNLEALGGKNEINFAERWLDFIDYPINKKEYKSYPEIGDTSYALPLPNNIELFENINNFIIQHNNYYNLTEADNRLLVIKGRKNDLGRVNFDRLIIKEVPGKSSELYFRDFVREYQYSLFLPLIEVPVVYNQIYGGEYVPSNKKQNIRDKDGVLLKPKSSQKDVYGFIVKAKDDEFEMAPMMKGVSDKKVSFTDFTIDATTDSFYFYGVREIGSTMKLGEFSPFIGPVKVVDANTPEAPKINSALPILNNNVLGINPKIKIEIHAYSEVQKIKRINLYRTTDRNNAQAIMHMDLIKTVDVSDVSTNDSNIWTLYDEFDSFEKVPYGDAIYYRITVEKHIEYSKADYITGGETPEVIIDYVPSQPSKIISTLIVESQNPESPTPKFITDEILENATSINYGALTWNHTLYRGKYHVYKMSAQGNWSEIAKLEIDPNNPNQYTLYRLDGGIWNKIEILEADNNDVILALSQLNLLPLIIKDSQGNNVYHHFKVIAENNSNMLSTQENILTIFNNDNIVQLDGISSDGIDGMITDKTFIIR